MSEMTIQLQAASLAAELVQENGRCVMSVAGLSMTPFIRHGDRVTLISARDSRLNIGDVVLVAPLSGGFPMLHRIIRQRGDQYLIKGDRMIQPDGFFKREHIKARAVFLERGGKRKRLDGRTVNRVIAMFSMGKYLVRNCFVKHINGPENS